jgi:hypothetical protein
MALKDLRLWQLFGIIFGEAGPSWKVEGVVVNGLAKHGHFPCRDKSARYNGSA